jgi:hypothetical protein
MYKLDLYVNKGVLGLKVNTTTTLVVLALGFVLGYAYYIRQ